MEAELCFQKPCVAKRKKLGRRTRFSGEIILSDLSLRIRLDLKTSRWACGLASNDAHRVPATTNVLRRLRPHPNPPQPAIQRRHL
ncbi:hypothetical protein [Lapidilactobacillus salsurivasis]